MQCNTSIDGTVAVLLGHGPAYRRWTNPPLDDRVRRLLSEADDQQLMSIVAHALQRLKRQQARPDVDADQAEA